MTSESEVLTRVESGIGRIILNRREALHGLNRAMGAPTPTVG